MEAYSDFAEVYDEFMKDIPYDMWCDYIASLLRTYQIDRGLVLELGCGTGEVTERLAARGYDMIGIDNSEEMLSKAVEKNAESETRILYLLQDIREFELYGTVSGVVSVCDTMNYILEEEDMADVFRSVNNYLEKRGIFIFDLKTKYYFRNVVGNSILAENHDEASYIWENNFYDDENINEYNLTIFQRQKESELYKKSNEKHYQRAYSLEEIKKLIETGGMEFVAAYDAFTMHEPTQVSGRIYIVAREKMQQGKFYSENEY